MAGSFKCGSRLCVDKIGIVKTFSTNAARSCVFGLFIELSVYVVTLAEMGKIDSIVVLELVALSIRVQREQELETFTIRSCEPRFSSFWVGGRLRIGTQIALLLGRATAVKGSSLDDRIRALSSVEKRIVTRDTIEVSETSRVET